MEDPRHDFGPDPNPSGDGIVVDDDDEWSELELVSATSFTVPSSFLASDDGESILGVVVVIYRSKMNSSGFWNSCWSRDAAMR